MTTNNLTDLDKCCRLFFFCCTTAEFATGAKMSISLTNACVYEWYAMPQVEPPRAGEDGPHGPKGGGSP